jgi:hypothetical protein
MPECPKCRRFIRESVYAQILECPTCKLPLKAHGHPLIPLHYAQGEAPLCQTCLYESDNTCNLPKRPDARQCTLYQNLDDYDYAKRRQQQLTVSQQLKSFYQRYSLWIGLAALAIASVAIALTKSR